MKIGQRVSVIDENGDRLIGEIVDLVGRGISLYHKLKVVLNKGKKDEKVLHDLPYQKDANDGEPHWLFIGERRKEETVDKPVADLVAFPDTPEAAPVQEPVGKPPTRKRA